MTDENKSILSDPMRENDLPTIGDQEESKLSEEQVCASAPPVSEAENAVISEKQAKAAFCKSPRAVGYVFFALAALSFLFFAIISVPFIEIVFRKAQAADIGEAFGQIFGSIFSLVFMIILAIPVTIFSILSAIRFGRAIGCADEKKKKITYIVIFSLSLLFLLYEAVLATATGILAH